jgi:uncharacterized protein YbjT (DUF2867 family)
MILVIGGRSKIGSALIDELLARDQQVRVLVRTSEKADSFPAGVEAVRGDLADPESLARAMAGIQEVFLLCGPSAQEVQLNCNAIGAARESGVELLVRSSILGADPSSPTTFARDHGACDRYLAESGVPYALVRPNLFLQNVPENTIPALDEDGNFYVNAADARISMVDTRDVASVAAALLTGAGHKGKAYDVTGPEALSYADVATRLAAVAGRKITYVDVPDAAVHDALSGFGLDAWLAEALVDLYRDYKRSGVDGYASEVTTTVQDLTGTSSRTLDALIEESRDALTGPRRN